MKGAKTTEQTVAEAKAREKRLRAAGITVVNPGGTSTVTLLARVADDARTEDLLADDDGSGVVE